MTLMQLGLVFTLTCFGIGFIILFAACIISDLFDAYWQGKGE